MSSASIFDRAPGSSWLLVPAAISLGLFAWLLTLHPTAAGRTYAAYGGVYVATATLWLWLVDDQPLCTTDIVGAAMAITGMGVIFLGARAD
ncbi:YnfA family protein [Methylohalobius crimeensis]|uniref:YnfA family protein n=1 Tax=Methylohalobius crimeensis TaxID=244365 RepID=UPI0003B384F7|nr:YnfA family protein [Methylohalobius crimeensis]